MTTVAGPPVRRHISRVDPATGSPIAVVPIDDGDEVHRAVDAAREAASGWMSMSASNRGELVRRAADRLEGEASSLGSIVTTEMGKPIADAIGDVHAAVGTARQYAQLGPLHRGRSLQGANDSLDTMYRVPLGVVACLVPWNDPVTIAVQGVAAAVVTGNTVVLKPSERATRAVVAALDCFDHLPAGVINIVTGGPETGRHLVDADIDAVVFTGSVATGRTIARSCAGRFIPAVLELGGNDALVVDADVDPEWAADQASLGCFANAGQICVSVERIFCHDAVRVAFVDALVERARGLVMGDPRDRATQLGPLVDRSHRQHVHSHVADAIERGATLRVGGAVPDGPGAFYPATVLDDVPATALTMHEETFGPVAGVSGVPSFDEGLRRAASSDFGLAATVLTRDPANSIRAARELPVGSVKVNAVFGGAPGGSAHPHGISGTAQGYGPELLDELTRVRSLHLEAAPPMRT